MNYNFFFMKHKFMFLGLFIMETMTHTIRPYNANQLYEIRIQQLKLDQDWERKYFK